MSHYDFINAPKMSDAEAALIRARRHLRSGKRYLQEGSSAAGIAAFYDAILFGMRYYIALHKGPESLAESADHWDASALFHALARSGVFDDPLTFNRCSLMVERALWQGSFAFDANAMLVEVEKILSRLGIIPFHGSSLPATHH